MTTDIQWNIGKIIQKWALATPEKQAIIVDGKSQTYDELNCEANKIAHAFNEMGLRKGDRIAVLCFNCIEVASAYIAAAKLGLVFIPLNNRLTSKELLFQLTNSGSSALILDEPLSDRIEPIIEELGFPSSRILSVSSFDPESETTTDWHTSLKETIVTMPSREPEPTEPVLLNDPLAIIYTSGTTGAPKGAVVSHLETHFKCLQVILYGDLRQDDKWFTMMPLFRSGGMFVALTPILLRGATLITSKNFNGKRFLEYCKKYKPSVLLASTTMWRLILKDIDPGESYFDSVRVCFGGGEVTPMSLIEQLENIGIQMRMGFGQTENSFMASQSVEHIKSHYGAVGRAGFFTDIWIQNKQGETAVPGEIGEIVARGPTVMSGYWDLPEKTAETIVDGVLHTGDLGYIDEDGHIFLSGREKDMYRTGGENVYPAEIENILSDHPDIHDASVIGVTDPDWGETGKAFIVLEKDATLSKGDILAFLNSKLARYKLPKHFEFIDALPVNDSGKALKNELRKRHDSAE